MKQLGRNDPCSCQSGKKYKHCCLGKNQRAFGVSAKFKPGQSAHFEKLEPDGTFTFLDKDQKPIVPESVEIQYGIIRKNKPNPKPIASFKSDPGRIRLLDNYHFQEFDGIFAIDTNSGEINGQKVSVGAVIVGNFSTDHQNKARGLYWPRLTFEFRNPRENPELLMWELALRGIEQDDRFSKLSKIAFIVDSHQPLLIQINNRERPILGTYYLPKNVVLLYASAETGSEYFGNHMIKLADKVASEVFKTIKSNYSDSENLHASEDPRYDQYRYWETGIVEERNQKIVRRKHYSPEPYSKTSKTFYKIREYLGSLLIRPKSTRTFFTPPNFESKK